MSPPRTETHRKPNPFGAFGHYVELSVVFGLMLEEERGELRSWERSHRGVPSSDWPGFRKYSHVLHRPLWWDEAPAETATVKVPIPEALRWEVFERDGFACVHCGSRRFLRADHIVPESKGGAAEVSNLQTLCRSCNSKKGTRV